MRPIDLWSLGYPDAALADTEDALRNAREFGEAEAIDSVSILFDALPKIVLGKLDELPDRIRRDLAGTADAKISALDHS